MREALGPQVVRAQMGSFLFAEIKRAAERRSRRVTAACWSALAQRPCVWQAQKAQRRWANGFAGQLPQKR